MKFWELVLVIVLALAINNVVIQPIVASLYSNLTKSGA